MDKATNIGKNDGSKVVHLRTFQWLIFLLLE